MSSGRDQRSTINERGRVIGFVCRVDGGNSVVHSFDGIRGHRISLLWDLDYEYLFVVDVSFLSYTAVSRYDTVFFFVSTC